MLANNIVTNLNWNLGLGLGSDYLGYLSVLLQVTGCIIETIWPLQDILNLRDGQSVHLQASLVPVHDQNLCVEWKFNGKPLPNSSRIKTVCDFGYVMLDIAAADSRDSGEYTCRAYNK